MTAKRVPLLVSVAIVLFALDVCLTTCLGFLNLYAIDITANSSLLGMGEVLSCAQ